MISGLLLLDDIPFSLTLLPFSLRVSDLELSHLVSSLVFRLFIDLRKF
jgi:hypothetical protein